MSDVINAGAPIDPRAYLKETADYSINVPLMKAFVDEFISLKNKYGEGLATLNGLSNKQLGYTPFIDNFIDKNTTADASIDGSANVSNKDIVTLESEMRKPHSKLIGFNKIFYELCKQYDLETAQAWLRAEWIGWSYLHDAHNTTFKPYCYAYSLKRLVNEGLYWIKDFNNSPPAHLYTYTDFVGEYISYNCNRTSGAVGLPSFLVYSMYFWLKDYKNGVVLKDPEYYRDQSFQEIIYRINEPFLRDSIQSAFTNFSIFDRYYFEALFGGDKFPDGTYIIDYEDEFMEYQKAFMRVLSKIRSENMMTYPVLSYSLLRKKNPKHPLDQFADEEFARWCSDHNCLWTDSNFFADTNVNSLSNCCRLKSDINNPYFNSIGGTALSVGSVKVNTLNLARISYECATPEEYLVELKNRALINLKALHVVRHIIKRNVDKGLLPNYTLGNIDIKNQYNTLGVNGLYEAIQKYGFVVEDEFGNRSYSDEGLDFAKQIMEVLKSTNKEFGADKDYMINIEQIPGEKAASVLMEKDRIFHPGEIYELPLYGNQWIPLGVKTTIEEKIRISAILDEACSGGSISHINIEAPFADKEEAWKALNYIVSKGVTYFAFTSKICTCAKNHGFFGSTCPKCGGKVKTKWRRIVGFYVPYDNYSETRKAETDLRQDFDPSEWTDVLAGFDLQ